MICLRIPGPSFSHGLVSIVYAFASSGCDPGVRVDGTVQNSDGAPVVGAVVELRCPEKSLLSERAITNDAGVFAIPPFIGCASANCTVLVKKQTGQEAEFAVRDHCRGRKFSCGRTGCNDIRVEAKF